MHMTCNMHDSHAMNMQNRSQSQFASIMMIPIILYIIIRPVCSFRSNFSQCSYIRPKLGHVGLQIKTNGIN